jgi:hypothetical protein
MALSISDVIDKLIDNANLGKLVTDVGSGLALSVSVVMLLGLVGRMSVLPADRAPELSKDVADAQARLDTNRQALRPVLQYFFTGAAPAADGAALGATTDGDALAALARRAVAATSSRLEIIDAQVSALVRKPDFSRDQVKALLDEKAPIAARNDRLLAQMELIDTDQTRLTTARNKLDDALSFPQNIEVFTSNISAVLAFAVIFGLILSQISRLLFVTLIYDKYITRTAKVTTNQAVQAGTISQEQSNDLVRDYYRYVEGSINMVMPTLLFGIVFPLYAGEKLPEIGVMARLVVLVVSVATALGLVVSGFYTYKEYRRRVDLLIG